MAVANPSNTYKWVLPIVGAAVGAWGGILNTIFGEDGVGGGVKGIDQVITDIQTDLDTAEASIVTLEADITTLENSGATAFFARSSMSAGQSIPKANATQVTWGTSDFDQGGLITPDAKLITIPTGGGGAYMIRASIQMERTVGSGSGGDDDGRQIIISIRKAATVVAQASIPYLNDGVDRSNSGDVTVAVAYLDGAAVASDEYDVTVFQTFFDGGTGSAQVRKDTGSFFEAVRFAPTPA